MHWAWVAAEIWPLWCSSPCSPSKWPRPRNIWIPARNCPRSANRASKVSTQDAENHVLASASPWQVIMLACACGSHFMSSLLGWHYGKLSWKIKCLLEQWNEICINEATSNFAGNLFFPIYFSIIFRILKIIISCNTHVKRGSTRNEVVIASLSHFFVHVSLGLARRLQNTDVVLQFL